MTRPKKPDKALKVNVSARIDPAVKTRLDRMAADRKWSTSQCIEVALVAYFERTKPKPSTGNAD